MKKLFIILSVLISVQSFAQLPTLPQKQVVNLADSLAKKVDTTRLIRLDKGTIVHGREAYVSIVGSDTVIKFRDDTTGQGAYGSGGSGILGADSVRFFLADTSIRVYLDGSYYVFKQSGAGGGSGTVGLPHQSTFTAANGTPIASYLPETGEPWTVVSGDGFEIQSNKADAIFDGSNLSTISNPISGQDYQAEVTLSRDNYDVLFYLRATDLSNCLRIQMNATHTTVQNVVGGSVTAISSSVATGLGTSTTKTVQITLEGNSLTLYIDATPVVTGLDISAATHTGGKFAVGVGLGQIDLIEIDTYP
jgi:hypothetical protein